MSNIKIWGVRSGLIGDMIMALPIAEYLKKKYPDSILTWVIQKKCSQAAPLYINQKYIDKIYVTEGWENLSDLDLDFKKSHDIIINESPPIRDLFWYNKMSCIEQTNRMALIDENIGDNFPKLIKWWVSPRNQNNENNHGYSTFEFDSNINSKTVAIFPFAHYSQVQKRSPTKEWWDILCEMLKSDGYIIKHFGWVSEPNISGVFERRTNISFFEQIKEALECDIVIGTDSGSMWVIGAYSHPAIHVMTYHMDCHNENPYALEPKNENGFSFFNPKSCNLIKQRSVLEKVKEYEENLFSTRHNI